MAKRVEEILSFIETRAPSSCSESWDNTGLLVGNLKTKVSSVIVSDDLTENALQLAQKKNAQLLVTHHPCIFPKMAGISRIVVSEDRELSTLILKAIERKIAIIACHTNFDRCALEVIHRASDALGLKPLGRLFEKNNTDELCRLIVFVPTSHIEKVSQAVFKAGAGQIGNYDQCSFQTKGVGQFRGLGGTHPYLGKPGKKEKVTEVKFETIFLKSLKSQILKAVLESHPYEEVAYDFIPLIQSAPTRGFAKGLGYGFYGDFSSPQSWDQISKKIAETFGVKTWICTPGAHRSKYKRLAFIPGKGSSFVGSALYSQCDVLVTGEAGYHAALHGARKGLTVVEVGHRESELFFLQVQEQWLRELGLKVFIENSPTQRFQNLEKTVSKRT